MGRSAGGARVFYEPRKLAWGSDLGNACFAGPRGRPAGARSAVARDVPDSSIW
jgi:hypothetical protein